jgi:hypothetical protein
MADGVDDTGGAGFGGVAEFRREVIEHMEAGVLDRGWEGDVGSFRAGRVVDAADDGCVEGKLEIFPCHQLVA